MGVLYHILGIIFSASARNEESLVKEALREPLAVDGPALDGAHDVLRSRRRARSLSHPPGGGEDEDAYEAIRA